MGHTKKYYKSLEWLHQCHALSDQALTPVCCSGAGSLAPPAGQALWISRQGTEATLGET